MKVAPIGLGTWAIGGATTIGKLALGWSGISDESSLAAMDCAFASGVNLVDTAPTYGFGHSERLLAQALRPWPDVVVLDKVGRHFTANGWASDLSSDFMIRSCEQSLTRLGRQSIDFYLLHNPNEEQVLRSRAVGTLEKLKAQGLIGHIGFSSHSPQTAAKLARWRCFDAIELEYSILNQSADEVLAEIKTQGVALLAIVPLYYGWLTGKYTSPLQFPQDDWRRAYFSNSEHDGMLLSSVCRRIQERLAAKGRTLTQTALRFLLQQDMIDAVIVGVHSDRQVRENLAAMDAAPLTDVELGWLKSQDFLQADPS